MDKERLKGIDAAYYYLIIKNHASRRAYFIRGVIVGTLLNMGIAILLFM